MVLDNHLIRLQPAGSLELVEPFGYTPIGVTSQNWEKLLESGVLTR